MPYTMISDLLEHPKVVETREHLHHYGPKYEHLIRSVRFSYHLAPMFNANRDICVRAALLHDIDSRLGTLTTHGEIAARYAAEIGESEQVCRAIVSHMYPFGPAPTTREGWVLVVADKLASLTDVTCFVRGLFTGQSQRTRRQLLASDPFVTHKKRNLLVKQHTTRTPEHGNTLWWRVRGGRKGGHPWPLALKPRQSVQGKGSSLRRMRFFRGVR